MDPNLVAAIAPGYSVHSSDDEKLGEVVAVHSAVIHVRKGFFFTKDYNVPHSAVASVDPAEGEVYLNVSKHDAMNPEWELGDDETSDEPPGEDEPTSGAPRILTGGASLVAPLIVDETPNPVISTDRPRST